ncbi:MAG: alpha/beta fold hydrolase [Litoreibacter sp.]
MLSVTPYGDTTRQPPLLIAHGLFGSARNWNVLAKRLSDNRQVYVVDMRNHGDSPREDTQSYADMAGDLAKILEGPYDLLGHSMGGKAAMVLALSQPESLRRLIVADIAPVTYTHTQLHLIDAMRAVNLDIVEKRSDADLQLRKTVTNYGIRAFLLQSLDVKTKSWKLNLDVLEAEMHKIIGFPDVKGHFEGSTLFLSGANSDYVLPEHRTKIKTLFPKAHFAKIPDAGHWLHAEKPRDFEASLRVFLDAS